MTLPLNKRLPLYGLFIKELPLVIGGLPYPMEMALILKSRPLPSVVPNLRCLKVSLYLSAPFDMTEVFKASIGTGLQDVTINIKAGQDDIRKIDRALLALARRLQDWGGDLKKLNAIVTKDPGEPEENILPSATQQAWCQAIQSMPKLTWLELPDLGPDSSDDLVITMSLLPSLENLSLYCPQLSGDVRRRMGGTPFPSLHYLVLEMTTLSAISIFLHLVDPDEITELDICTVWRPEEPTLSTELTVLRRFSYLQFVTFVWNSTQTDWPSLFEPLLACRLLRLLDVTCLEPPTYITDERLLILAQNWPDIVRLNIKDLGGQEDRPVDWIPRATLQGLACFVKRCPALRGVGLSVDACDTPEDFVVEALANKLNWMRLHYSEADDESFGGIVHLLSHMLPIIKPGAIAGDFIEWDLDSVQGEIWEQIYERVRELRDVPPPVRAVSPDCL